MRAINLGLEYWVDNNPDKEARKPGEIAGDGFFVDENSWRQIIKRHYFEEGVHSLGDDRDDKKSYPLHETHYQRRVREGFLPKLVTPKDVPPGIAGMYKPANLKAPGIDKESLEHEEWHHELHVRGEVTATHEEDVRKIMRNMLNFYGKRGDYHL